MDSDPGPSAPRRDPSTSSTPSTPTDPFSDSRSPPTNPFASPELSRPASSFNSLAPRPERAQRYFHSRRIRKGEVEKPWLEKKDPREKWVTILPILGVMVGLGIAGFLVWDGIRSVVRHKYCEVLIEDFSRGLRESIWMKEVELGGFGNGEFAMTTPGDENVFVEDGRLIIRATLQDDSLITKDSKIDLLKDGTCTSDQPSRCVAVTNATVGNATIVPPAKSGRINTRPSAKIKYGRVEVTARMPVGDWLWPAIWMMPVKDTYGEWPASGEIDIAESRGNNWTYPQGGNNIISSALHWGPDAPNDAWWRTNNKRSALHSTYGDGFNTFGVEWSQKYLFTYVNSRLLQVMYTSFEKPFWERGDFPGFDEDGERIVDPWVEGGKQAPFDQEFFLILNLAVGGENGWFEDGVAGKPWRDGSENAKKDFWGGRGTWFPTWERPQMEVSRVEIWQQCNGDEEL